MLYLVIRYTNIMVEQNNKQQDLDTSTRNTQQLNSNATTSSSNTKAQEEKEKEEKAILLFEALTLGALILDSELLEGREVTEEFWRKMVEVVTEKRNVLEDEGDERKEDGLE